MNPAVQGYAAAVLDATTGPQRGTLVSDVGAVDRLLRRNAELRAALTDVVVPQTARHAVLAELLAGKVSTPAARLCAFVAGAVRAQEVPAAVSWAANRLRLVVEREAGTHAAGAGAGTHATGTGAGSEVEAEELLGHREARERVGGYAACVFEDLSVAELETVEDELFRFSRIVDATRELRGPLSDRDLPMPVRRAVVDDLLSGKVHPATLRLADYAVVGGRPRDLAGTLGWLVEQVATARGWRVARVHAGQEVDAEERRHLSETLSRLVGSSVELQVTVDPALLAGVQLEIGDLELDATARGRLQRLREHVTTGGWTDLGFGRLERSAHRGQDQGREGPGGTGPAGTAPAGPTPAGTAPAGTAPAGPGQDRGTEGSRGS